MGQNNSTRKLNPKTIKELRDHVDVEFTKEEIQDWHKDFSKYLKPGRSELSKEAFIQVYNSLFYGDASDFAEQVFRTFDHDGNNSVDFKEFIIGLCMSGSENTEAKLKWAFNMYDLDQNGYIEHDEMNHILKAVCKMTGSKIPEEFKSPEDMTEHVFKILDKNSDNKITLEEFLDGANKVKVIVDILQCDPDS